MAGSGMTDLLLYQSIDLAVDVRVMMMSHDDDEKYMVVRNLDVTENRKSRTTTARKFE